MPRYRKKYTLQWIPGSNTRVYYTVCYIIHVQWQSKGSSVLYCESANRVCLVCIHEKQALNKVESYLMVQPFHPISPTIFILVACGLKKWSLAFLFGSFSQEFTLHSYLITTLWRVSMTVVDCADYSNGWTAIGLFFNVLKMPWIDSYPSTSKT